MVDFVTWRLQQGKAPLLSLAVAWDLHQFRILQLGLRELSLSFSFLDYMKLNEYVYFWGPLARDGVFWRQLYSRIVVVLQSKLTTLIAPRHFIITMLWGVTCCRPLHTTPTPSMWIWRESTSTLACFALIITDDHHVLDGHQKSDYECDESFSPSTHSPPSYSAYACSSSWNFLNPFPFSWVVWQGQLFWLLQFLQKMCLSAKCECFGTHKWEVIAGFEWFVIVLGSRSLDGAGPNLKPAEPKQHFCYVCVGLSKG